ncbi:MAG: LysM peptidoglycan-binding domain-containing protein [Candidatus Krumholzibacteria bacterium]|nr:LysM peptidoglycan-binding domain-containing protein [Candidatus Krumholzibacteria bacterium]
MSRILIWLSLIVALTWGCTSVGRHHPTSQPEAMAASDTLSPHFLGELRVGVDSAAALFLFGDIADFLSARDSLNATLDSALTYYPSINFDPDLKDVLKSLADLDSMANILTTSHEHLNETDSLALSIEDWPEIDSTQSDISIHANGDTVFPTMRNDRIDFWIRYFTGPGKERFARTLYRMQLYRPTIERILNELELPNELICVAMIESGFNLKARSRARAVGPWQFIAGTARIYGLRVSWWYDERRDIVASTYAAGNYLKDLYGIWNSWPLALASYNCGEYRVARAVARHRTSNFWKLRLPKQTERYVPKFLAALYLLREPERHGFSIPDVEPIAFDEVTIKDATDVKLIARSANTSVEVLRDLNPSLLRWATPPKMEIRVKVPVGGGEVCARALERIPPEQRVTWRKHRIRHGETLSVIAGKYRTTVSALKRLNGIRNAHRIRAGKYLIVPIQGGFSDVASAKPRYTNKRRNLDKKALEKYAARYAPPTGHKRVVYRVKSGDTLGEIAEEFRTSARKLRAWNNLSYRSHIYPGQKLAIYVPEAFDVSKLPSTKQRKPNEKDYTRKSYTVKKGDTIYGISRKFNVKMGDVLAWNNRSGRNSRIYPGQTLDIWQKK